MTTSTTPVVTPVVDRPVYFHLAWGPIWGGVVAAVAIQAVLTVLGMAIGLSIVQAGQPAGEGLGIAAGIWWVLSGLVALFVGGWFAGYLATPKSPGEGAMNGFIVWCVVTTLSVVLLTTAGGAALGGIGGLAVNQQPAANPATQQVHRQPVGAQQPIGQDDAAIGMQQVTPRQFADTGAGVAWWSFVILALGAGAAAVGGSLGHRGTYRRRLT